MTDKTYDEMSEIEKTQYVEKLEKDNENYFKWYLAERDKHANTIKKIELLKEMLITLFPNTEKE